MTHYDLIRKNKRRSYLIIISFIVFFSIFSYLISLGFESRSLMVIAILFSLVSSFISYYWSDRIILTISGAKKANREDHFDFFTVTENLCIGARLPTPDLYVIEDSAMNAFATGRNPKHAVVCATTGLLNRLDRHEIEGVVAHELSHIENYDILVMSLAAVLVGSITLISDWIFRSYRITRLRGRDKESRNTLVIIISIITALISPFIAQMIKLAISRKREYLADADAAALTKNPNGLIKALKKISNDAEILEASNKATAHLYITNPFKPGHKGSFLNLFRSHPPIEKRIQALQSIQ